MRPPPSSYPLCRGRLLGGGDSDGGGRKIMGGRILLCICVVYIYMCVQYYELDALLESTCHDSFPFLSFLIPFEPVSYYYNCFRILCSKKRRDKGEGWRQRREKKGGWKGGGEEEKEEEESRGPEGKGSWEPK